MSFNLYVDDIRSAPTGWVLARTIKESINYLKTGNVDCLSLDHDLGSKQTGMDIVNYCIDKQIFPNRIEIHSKNPVGKQNMIAMLLRYGPYRRRTLAPILTKDVSLWADLSRERR